MLLTKRARRATYGVLVVLMLAGTVLDLQISYALYAPETLFATFFAAYGETPALLCAWAGAACLFASVEGRRDRRAQALRVVLCLALFASLAGYLGYKPYPFVNTPVKAVLTVVEGLLAVGLFAWVLRTADRGDRVLLARMGAVLVLVVAFNLLVVTVVKIPWGRPRFRSVVTVEGLEFRSWYQPGTSLREAFEGILAHEEFKSFPSGHTANAACGLALALLARVVPALRGRERMVVLVALAWTVAVMVARIVAGAHYLSDVTMGLAVTLSLLLLLHSRLAEGHGSPLSGEQCREVTEGRS